MIVRELIALLGFKTDDRSLQKAESSMDKLADSALTLSRIFLSGAVVAGFGKLIDLASESAESANKFRAVFGSAQEEVQQQLADTTKRTGIASLQLQQFAANIGAIVRPALGSAEAAGKVGATMAELALDVASFNDVRPDEALIALRSGLIGSAEPLQRFGVDVRVAALEQEALRLGIRGSIKELTEGQRIQIRTSAILRQLGSQGALGDATRTSKEFANASRALASQLKQLGAVLGGFLLKDAGRTVAIFSQIVTAINGWIEANRDLIQQRVDTVLQVINNTIEGIARVLLFAVDGWRQLSEIIGPTASSFLDVVGVLLTLVSILGAPLTLLLAIGAAIGLIIDDLVVFAKGGESAFGLLLESLEEFLGGFDGIGEFFDRLIAKAVEFWNSFFTTGEESSSGFVDNFVSILSGAWATVIGVWDELTGGFFDGAFEKVQAFAIMAAERATEIFQVASDRVRGFIEENGPRVLAFLRELGAGALEFFRDTFTGTLGRIIIDFLGAKAGAAVGEFVGELIGKLAGQIAGKGIVGRAISSIAGERVLGALGKVVGGITGGVLADIKIGRQLPELFGGIGTQVAAPATAPGGGVSLTQGGVEINQTIQGGSGTPEQVGNAAAAAVKQAMDGVNRQTMQQMTTAGAAL